MGKLSFIERIVFYAVPILAFFLLIFIVLHELGLTNDPILHSASLLGVFLTFKKSIGINIYDDMLSGTKFNYIVQKRKYPYFFEKEKEYCDLSNSYNLQHRISNDKVDSISTNRVKCSLTDRDSIIKRTKIDCPDSIQIPQYEEVKVYSSEGDENDIGKARVISTDGSVTMVMKGWLGFNDPFNSQQKSVFIPVYSGDKSMTERDNQKNLSEVVIQYKMLKDNIQPKLGYEFSEYSQSKFLSTKQRLVRYDDYKKIIKELSLNEKFSPSVDFTTYNDSLECWFNDEIKDISDQILKLGIMIEIDEYYDVESCDKNNNYLKINAELEDDCFLDIGYNYDNIVDAVENFDFGLYKLNERPEGPDKICGVDIRVRKREITFVTEPMCDAKKRFDEIKENTSDYRIIMEEEYNDIDLKEKTVENIARYEDRISKYRI